ncbi:MAG: DMT family transporter [Alphaproteobacteria bacterium]
MPSLSAVRARIAASPTLTAVALMVTASALLASMHGMVRYMSFGLPAFEIAFFRNMFGFAVLIPFIAHHGSRLMRVPRFGLHALRGGLNGASMLIWFSALSLVPLAEATALSLTGPLFVTLGAMVFLGERVRTWRWVALLLGASGALFIIRPGFDALNIGMLFAVFSTVLAAGSKIVAKTLTRTEDPAIVAAMVQFLMIPVTFVAALFVWQWPTLAQLGGLAVIGVFGGLGHLCFTKAYAIADLSFTEPIVFLRMVWATLFGLLVFAELPDPWSWVGVALILGATAFIAQRERRARRDA